MFWMREDGGMELPNDIARCAGVIGQTPCPSRESCRRYVQLPYRDERPGARYVWCWPTEPDPEHPDRCDVFMEAIT